MNFLQFAFNNVKRNARAYFAYFLSSAFMVMIFFTYAMFIFHPDLAKSEMGRMTGIGMEVAEYIIFVFSILFVLFSIGSFLKARSKEFGVLSLLGATTGSINRLVFLENLIIGVGSIAAGLAGGLLLSKLFLLLSVKVTGMNRLPFYMPWKAMGFTAVAFLVLFVVLSVFTLVFFRKNRVIELLGGGSKPKTEPRVSWVLALLGVALLTSAVLLLKGGDGLDFSKVMLAAATGIWGTYFFYTQVTVALIRLLKRSRRLLWRGTRLLWVSEMAYKIKDNARMLFMVTVAISLACMSVGVILAANAQNERVYTDNPFAFSYGVYEQEFVEADMAWIDEQLSKQGVRYETLERESFFGYIGSSNFYVDVVSRSEYNKAAALLGAKSLPEIGKGRAIAYAMEGSAAANVLKGETIPLSLSFLEEPLQLELQPSVVSLTGTNSHTSVVVLSDADFAGLKNGLSAENQNRLYRNIDFYIPAWQQKGAPGLQDPNIVIGKSLYYGMMNRLENGVTDNYMSSRGRAYAETREQLSMLSFVGIFIAAIFSVSSASFLYFKLYSELNQDRRMYHSLSKIGLGDREMRYSSSLQIALLFFIPVVISGIQTMVVLSLLGARFLLGDVTVPVLTATGAFLAAQLLYFAVVRSRYVVQLKRVMV
ncbi:ABC transporter permease [Paenibacillus sp. MBLB2552]|uniref:ABC transporter permease n=1 Tax=Paenibacillus mellifer TaxID=2937794 RepID=A0A9X1Y242_9BACL|nr:ABC transporter permease [Paenibacillus mellifer]MCK8485962.1 ABC transporter permease [Paenibacillus mellifer]